MDHSPGFLKLVNEAKARVKEMTVEEARRRLRGHPPAVLVDVREDSEWEKEHAAEAIHLGKGVLERDLEETIADPKTELILYCGGGFRSALAADTAQRMGYTNVYSLAGGFRAMTASQWPMKKGKS